ncbi:MAG: 50S ribosomal protein L13 [Myxococcales bacterium]|nr:50S ribosomal protein L13 [Myxococcota bacterium]MDW8281480.1 50S ribosomal protein L13 [Myxococcales bacterium]
MSTPPRRTAVLTQKQAQDARAWHVVDVAGLHLGRAATQIAHLLRGKHKPTFTPHLDCGDFVIVLNAQKVLLSGKKLQTKMYYRHSQYPGGLKARPAHEMLARKPDEVIRRAVWGMLPKGPLGRVIIKKLKVYPGAEHPHAAQQPVERKLETMRSDKGRNHGQR